MHKIYIILLASLFISISTYASNTIDSIGVENNKGKKVIIYQVEAKETYYSIAKKYNVNFKDVMEFNDSKFLQIGVTLKIPTNIPFTTTAPSKTSTDNIIEHTVIAKDNLNMLAEKYGTTVNDIKKANNLSSINLRIGQVLKIPSSGEVVTTTTEIVPTPTNPVNKTTIASTSDNTSTIEHTIKAKENLNLLAQKYNTTIDEIKRLNGLSSNNLQIGQVLKIPSANGEVAEAPTEKVVEQPAPKNSKKAVAEKPAANVTTPEPTNNDGSIEHVVAASETIYSIAKKYNSTTYQIKTANNLTSNDLTVGQKLIIKNAKPTTTTATEEEGTEEGSSTMKNPALKLPASRYGLSQIEEKGIAVWIADQDLDPTKMLILHRTVPVGTIIKITNPMTNRSTFAKVVGKFTENETTKDVIIVITKAVADAVGALDKRFFCNISYGALENEQ
jgi:peptidoglycan endopeptidase LytF